MSHFVECQTEFRNPQALIAALVFVVAARAAGGVQRWIAEGIAARPAHSTPEAAEFEDAQLPDASFPDLERRC